MHLHSDTLDLAHCVEGPVVQRRCSVLAVVEHTSRLVPSGFEEPGEPGELHSLGLASADVLEGRAP